MLSKTTNGMDAYSATGSALVDMLFKAGAMRQASSEQVKKLVGDAIKEDGTKGLRMTFWARDVREGAGERRFFREALQYLAENYPATVEKNMHLIPEYGRWDDVTSLIGTKVEKRALEVIADGLNNKDGLLAKWLPRPNGKSAHKTVANKIRKHMGLTPKQYRKMLVEGSNTVEQLMTQGRWTEIRYDKLPSLASARYQKAFSRHDPKGYADYINRLQKGQTTINAGAIMPYDILKSAYTGSDEVATEQWKALPNFLEGTNARPLVVADVSGSMGMLNYSAATSPIVIAVSLAIYMGQKAKGIFNNTFVTFSDSPSIIKMSNSNSLKAIANKVARAPWGMSTNLQAVFDMMLTAAKKAKVPADEMPNMIVIVSDMQFNSCTNGKGTAFTMLRDQYEAAGYEFPTVVFWNANAAYANQAPVQYDQSGVILVSGASAAVAKSVFSGNLDPTSAMESIVNSPRYQPLVF